MDRLPDEILLDIFGYLTTKDLVLRCGEVCQRWQRLVQDKSLWQEINLSSCTVPLRALVKLLKREGVRSLNLETSTIEDPKSWTNLFSPNELQTLNLSNALISPRALGHLLKSTSILTYVNLSGCRINHIACKAIVANSHLKRLDLSFCEKGPPGLYQRLFKNCQVLEELQLSHIRDLHRHVKYFESLTLRRLCAQYCDLEYWDMKHLVRQCPKLTHLDISYNYVGPYGAAKLKESFPNLLELIYDNHENFIESESDYESDAHMWESYDESSEEGGDESEVF